MTSCAGPLLKRFCLITLLSETISPVVTTSLSLVEKIGVRRHTKFFLVIFKHPLHKRVHARRKLPSWKWICTDPSTLTCCSMHLVLYPWGKSQQRFTPHLGHLHFCGSQCTFRALTLRFGTAVPTFSVDSHVELSRGVCFWMHFSWKMSEQLLQGWWTSSKLLVPEDHRLHGGEMAIEVNMGFSRALSFVADLEEAKQTAELDIKGIIWHRGNQSGSMATTRQFEVSGGFHALFIISYTCARKVSFSKSKWIGNHPRHIIIPFGKADQIAILVFLNLFEKVFVKDLFRMRALRNMHNNLFQKPFYIA